MDDLELRKLIEGSPEHWTDRALCVRDDRFTANPDSLTIVDWSDMYMACQECPVFYECNQWAKGPDITDVFAAGIWRFPENGDELS